MSKVSVSSFASKINEDSAFLVVEAPSEDFIKTVINLAIEGYVYVENSARFFGTMKTCCMEHPSASEKRAEAEAAQSDKEYSVKLEEEAEEEFEEEEIQKQELEDALEETEEVEKPITQEKSKRGRKNK
jgi:hypothetical protein